MLEVAKAVKQSYAEAVLAKKPFDRTYTNPNGTEIRKYENEVAWLSGQAEGVSVFMKTVFELVKEAEKEEELDEDAKKK